METSGLVMIAKSLDAQARLKRAFSEGMIRRRYAAYTERPIELGRHAGVMNVHACDERRGETEIVSEGRGHWKVSGGILERTFRSEIEVLATRPSELREFLARLGAPIIGDAKNGSRVTLVDGETGRSSLALRVIAMSFDS